MVPRRHHCHSQFTIPTRDQKTTWSDTAGNEDDIVDHVYLYLKDGAYSKQCSASLKRQIRLRSKRFKFREAVLQNLTHTNFSDHDAYFSILSHLRQHFHIFKCHEEIENKEEPSEGDRVAFGKRLKDAIADFTTDFIPHMKEEEEVGAWEEGGAKGEESGVVRVFLPLLVTHFSEGELRELTQTVNHLHIHDKCQGKDKPSASQEPPGLTSLPPEVLVKIFSYLSPVDLCHLSQSHTSLRGVAFNGSLWQHLHPVRWANENIRFFRPPCGDPSYDAYLENSTAKHLMSVEGRVNANLRMREEVMEEYCEREARVLTAVLEHLLPRVGPHVRTLDLAHGKAVSNEIVFRMLKRCPNLRYLDLSHTGVSDFAFKGSQTRPSRGLARPSPHTQPSSHNSVDTRGGKGGVAAPKHPCLKSLVLSRCHLITDTGLRALVVGVVLPELRHLDLSGLCRITREGLGDLVAVCPSLNPEMFFYCDNILHGPYADCANGCQSLGSDDICYCKQAFNS
eukprot:Em0001g1172a